LPRTEARESAIRHSTTQVDREDPPNLVNYIREEIRWKLNLKKKRSLYKLYQDEFVQWKEMNLDLYCTPHAKIDNR
jgi:hypothetical protein